MLLTINKTIKTVEPVTIEIETPSYYAAYGKRLALLEDETVIELFKYGSMYGITFYEKQEGCLNYQNKMSDIVSMDKTTEEEFGQLLAGIVKRSKIDCLFNHADEEMELFFKFAHREGYGPNEYWEALEQWKLNRSK